ncbi:YHS domain-containing protein [Oleiagrimonas sp. C23AA]|nr:YHS domain-containing protein [Oleiagrimonas sp. C23AA]
MRRCRHGNVALFHSLGWSAFPADALWLRRAHDGARSRGHAGEHDKPGPSNDTLRWTPPPTDIDPVCGKTVRTDGAKSAVHDGTVYYLCSRECRELFEAAPQLYPRSSDALHPAQAEHAHG